MDFILNLIVKSGGQVWGTFLHNWPYLVLSVALAALLKLYLDPQKVSAFLLRYQKAGVVGATAAAVTTPLCSCGTTALVLGMIANLMPWAPIVAFMVSSPLTSPEGLVYSAGLFGWRFALAYYAASIVLGLAGGAAAAFCDRRGWLANQTRQSLNLADGSRLSARPGRSSEAVLANGSADALRNASASGTAPISRDTRISLSQPLLANPSRLALQPAGCACSSVEEPHRIALAPSGCGSGSVEVHSPASLASSACGCDSTQVIFPAPLASPSCGCSQAETVVPPAGGAGCGCSGEAAGAASGGKSRTVTLRMLLEEMLGTGRRLLVMFLGFAFIGYFLNGLIPAAWITAVFGSGNAFSVPLAAVLGLPLYINSEASLPLVRAMLDAGMSQGAALAFLITGAGTSFGAVAGMLTIARWRVVGLVIGTLMVGAVLFGIGYNLVF